MKKTSKIVLGSALSIAMCASLIAGSTFALFTSESKTNIAVTSGKVDVQATIEDLTTYSYTETGEGTGIFESTEMTSGNFIFGTASLDDAKQTLTLNNIVPGDKAELRIKLTNNSTIAVKYQIVVSVEKDDGLYKALNVTLDGEDFVDSALSATKLTNWQSIEAKKEIPDLTVTVELPYTYEDKILNGDTTESVQGKSCTLTVSVQAVQGNAQTADPVDPADPDAANLVPVYSLDELKAFRDSVNEGNNYEGKTVKLMDSFDLENEPWTPIGTVSAPFKGTFDGDAHTVKNLTVSGLANTVRFRGLFGYINGTGATEKPAVKDLTLEGVEAHTNYYSGSVGYTAYGAVVGDALNATLENITVKALDSANSGPSEADIYSGGLIGHANAVDIHNCHVQGRMATYSAQLGGIAGFFTSGEVADCSVQVTVSGSHLGSFGGIVANFTRGGGSSVVRCFVDVTMTNSSYVTSAMGGIVGISNGVKTEDLETMKIEDCYVTALFDGYSTKDTGTIFGAGAQRCGLGGIAGYAHGTTLRNCYFNAKVPGVGLLGGRYILANHPGNEAMECTVERCSWSEAAESHIYMHARVEADATEETVTKSEGCSFKAGMDYEQFLGALKA